MSFGSKLREARKAKKLTQKELALKINAAHNSVSNWENDQNMPDPNTIQHLCWALDVRPNFFFDLIEISPADEGRALDEELTRLLSDLTPGEADKVRAFVHGLVAGRKE